jgi:hypothetical protein
MGKTFKNGKKEKYVKSKRNNEFDDSEESISYDKKKYGKKFIDSEKVIINEYQD